MNLGESITICFLKYAKFDGRASRSEYWWFLLFIMLVSGAAATVNDTVYGIVAFAFLLPYLSVASRRLHDLNKSSWWMLLMFVPLANLLLVVWYCMKGTDGPNQYGSNIQSLS